MLVPAVSGRIELRASPSSKLLQAGWCRNDESCGQLDSQLRTAAAGNLPGPAIEHERQNRVDSFVTPVSLAPDPVSKGGRSLVAGSGARETGVTRRIDAVHGVRARWRPAVDFRSGWPPLTRSLRPSRTIIRLSTQVAPGFYPHQGGGTTKRFDDSGIYRAAFRRSYFWRYLGVSLATVPRRRSPDHPIAIGGASLSVPVLAASHIAYALMALARPLALALPNFSMKTTVN